MRRLVLFAKRPRLGRVKTRLVPPLRPKQSLELYEAFLRDQIRFVRSFAEHCTVELWLDGPWTHDPPEELTVGDLRVLHQGPGDLGQRMLRAFRHAAQEGAAATVVLGADAPTLPATHVHQAFSQLERGRPVVVAPAFDGGYVLLGLRRPLAELFRGIPWGTPQVLRRTRERMDAVGIELLQLAAWYDVDDEDGLARLRRDLEDPRTARRAPSTARVLARLDSSGSSVV